MRPVPRPCAEADLAASVPGPTLAVGAVRSPAELCEGPTLQSGGTHLILKRPQHGGLPGQSPAPPTAPVSRVHHLQRLHRHSRTQTVSNYPSSLHQHPSPSPTTAPIPPTTTPPPPRAHVGWKTGPIPQGQGEAEEGVGHSRLAGGRFHQQGDLLKRVVWGGHKISGSPHRPQDLKAQREASTGPGHEFHTEVSPARDPLKAASLNPTPTAGTVGRMYIRAQVEGPGGVVRSLAAARPSSSGTNRQAHALSDFPQHPVTTAAPPSHSHHSMLRGQGPGT